MKTILSLVFTISSINNTYAEKGKVSSDMLIIGGVISGTMAGIQSARMK